MHDLTIDLRTRQVMKIDLRTRQVMKIDLRTPQVMKIDLRTPQVTKMCIVYWYLGNKCILRSAFKENRGIQFTLKMRLLKNTCNFV